jgi:hypothetical protein
MIIYGYPTIYYTTLEGNLKEAWFGFGAWHINAIAGDSGETVYAAGKFAAVPPTTDPGDPVHIFYGQRDLNNNHLTLRHAAGMFGYFEHATLDGHSSTGGRTTDSVGSYAAAGILDGVVNVFYYDETGGNLRHAWAGTGWPTSQTWSFEVADGDYNNAYGRRLSNLGTYPYVAVTPAGPSYIVLYNDDQNGDIRLRLHFH